MVAVRMRTRTDYDLEHLEDLQRVGGAMMPRSARLRRGFPLLLGALLLGTGLALLRSGQMVIALACCGAGALLAAWGVFFYKINAWLAGRTMQRGRVCDEFSFEKESVLAIQGENSTRHHYSNCQQLLETKLCFYFMMMDGQALMLDKTNLTGGTVDELRAWLESKTGQRSIRVGKS